MLLEGFILFHAFSAHYATFNICFCGETMKSDPAQFFHLAWFFYEQLPAIIF